MQVIKSPFRIKKTALDGLRDIASYTRKTWGNEQEEVYMKGIFSCFERIANHQTYNRDLSGIVSDCLVYKISHHLIIFRWLDDGRPEIIRVLHEKMDVPCQLVKSTISS